MHRPTNDQGARRLRVAQLRCDPQSTRTFSGRLEAVLDAANDAALDAALDQKPHRRIGLWRVRRIGALIVAASAVFTASAENAPAAATSSTAPPGHPQLGEGPRWLWPSATPHWIITGFAAPATRYSAGHRGIDIAAVPGSAVVAPVDGVIRFIGIVVDRPVLTLEASGDLLASSEPVRSELAAGTLVRAGDQIGVVASGGHCDGACLHFGVRLHGEYVSPLRYLGGIERAVLLPLQ